MTIFVLESYPKHSPPPECWIAIDEQNLIVNMRDGHDPWIPLNATLEEAESLYRQNRQDLRIFMNANEAAKAWSSGVWEEEQSEDMCIVLLDRLVSFAWEITDLPLRFEIVEAAWFASREKERKVALAAQEVMRAGIAAGLSEVRIAELLKVTPMVVSMELGK